MLVFCSVLLMTVQASARMLRAILLLPVCSCAVPEVE